MSTIERILFDRENIWEKQERYLTSGAAWNGDVNPFEVVKCFNEQLEMLNKELEAEMKND